MIGLNELSQKIISLSKGRISMMKLHKLCYYNQAWHCAFYNHKLVDDEFEALENGPCCRPLDNMYYAGEDGMLISDEADFTIIDYKFSYSNIDQFVETIYSLYGSYTGEMLSEMTHTESPWIMARNMAINAELLQDNQYIIRLDDMRECYKKHPFYDYISLKLGEIYHYKKYSVENGRLTIVDMDNAEKDIIKGLMEGLKITYFDRSIASHKVTHDGIEYEFFVIDHNIILLNQEVRDYIMEINKIFSELKEMQSNGLLNYYWQYDNSNQEKEFYSYTSPELGIMVNGGSLDETIINAIGMLLYIKKQCDHHECANEHEKNEKALVKKVYALYKARLSDFITLLGLNKDAQLQGEKINVD